MAYLTISKPELPLKPFGKCTLRERRVNKAGIYVSTCLILRILSNFGQFFSLHGLELAINLNLDLDYQKFVGESHLKAKNST